MKSNTFQKFMRTSYVIGIVFAAALIVIDFNLLSLSPISVSINTASAQELPSFTATTTLRVADMHAWSAPLPIAADESDAESADIAAPTTAAALLRTIQAKKATAPISAVPLRIIVPSIGLDTAIDPMGINAKGELDVPSGRSSHVGWHKGGPRPGTVGTAVLDAHVFAAFENLRYLKTGEDIIIETSAGQRLRFVAEESTVYKLSEITSAMLFGSDGARRLNLITCAGSPIGDTYSHRLVVYAKFVEIL